MFTIALRYWSQKGVLPLSPSQDSQSYTENIILPDIFLYSSNHIAITITINAFNKQIPILLKRFQITFVYILISDDYETNNYYFYCEKSLIGANLHPQARQGTKAQRKN